MTAQELSAVDRQRHVRSSVLCPGTLVIDGEEWPCQILNISAGGAKVSSATQPARSTNLILKMGRMGVFAAEVAWARDGELGLRFFEETQEAPLLVAKAQGDVKEKRQSVRRFVLWSGTLECMGERGQCGILNVSLGGVKVRTSLYLTPGAKATLHLERFGSLETTVVWQDDDFAGLRFRADSGSIRQLFAPAIDLPPSPDPES